MSDRFGFDWSRITGTQFWRGPRLSRRLFFRHAATAVGGYFLMPSRPLETVAKAAATPIGKAKNCIFIFLPGAPSHTDTFDLKEGSWQNAAALDLLKPTSYNDLRWPQGLMPTLAENLDSTVLVRSVRSWALVHQLGQVWTQISRNPTSGLAKIAPHIGAVASLELAAQEPNRTLPVFVSLNAQSGPANGYFAPEHGPFYVSPGGGGLGNTAHRDGVAAFQRRYELLQQLDAGMRGSGTLGAGGEEMETFNASARRLMYNPAVDQAFTFSQDERARYAGGNRNGTGFGNACLTAHRLLKSGLGTRFVQITFGGWDHHQNIYVPNTQLHNQARQLDWGLGTLISDLKRDNLLDDTLIVAMGEFGRTVGPLNNQGGRDHFLQQSVFFAGGRIRGGRAIGTTDEVGRATTDPGWSRGRDVRAEDVAATIYSALGIDWTTVRTDDPLGRGFEYVPFTASEDLYGPIHELWG